MKDPICVTDSDLAECVDFSYWWSYSSGGSAINGATPYGRLVFKSPCPICFRGELRTQASYKSHDDMTAYLLKVFVSS